MTFDDERGRARTFDEPRPEWRPAVSRPSIGAIAVRIGKGEPRVLLVRSRHNPEHWVFPNTAVAPGETPGEAAIRQLGVEGGVAGEVIAPAGAVEVAIDDRVVRVEYVLARAGDDVPGAGVADRRWCTLKEAAGLLSFVTSREMLARVSPLFARPSKR